MNRVDGTAADFETARSEFEAAWQEYLPKCTEADFDNCRRERAWTSWKYAMLDAGLKLPTQSSDQRARCLCGVPIDISGMAAHVYTVHMTTGP